jgi:alpha-tubulin suppressor-like RCC1 family protein
MLFLSAASAIGGCDRDFSFLDVKMPADSNVADTGTPDMSRPFDAEPRDASFEPENETGVDASVDSAMDAPGEVEAGSGRILPHRISLRDAHMCLIESSSGAVLCRGAEVGPGPDRDAAPNAWHAITMSSDGTKLSGARTLAVGKNFACAIANGDVWCWGAVPGTSVYSAIAQEMLPSSGLFIEHLQTGESDICVTSPAICWGDNTYSQITNLVELDAADIGAPRLIPSLVGKTLLTLGFRHTCANDGDKTFCWGLDDFRQCGNKADHQCLPTAPCAIEPIEVSGISGAFDLGLGVSHSCAIKADRTVACWGASDMGQSGALPPGDCGTDTCVVDVTPVDATHVRGVTRLALGAAHSCAMTSDGFVYCWGSNEAAQLGVNTIGGRKADPLMVQDAAGVPLGDIVDLSASDDFTCALKSSGKLYCWGLWMNEPVLAAATEIPLDL